MIFVLLKVDYTAHTVINKSVKSKFKRRHLAFPPIELYRNIHVAKVLLTVRCHLDSCISKEA